MQALSPVRQSEGVLSLSGVAGMAPSTFSSDPNGGIYSYHESPVSRKVRVLPHRPRLITCRQVLRQQVIYIYTYICIYIYIYIYMYIYIYIRPNQPSAMTRPLRGPAPCCRFIQLKGPACCRFSCVLQALRVAGG